MTNEHYDEVVVRLLQQIADALFELNESKRPRWVEFTYKGKPFSVDAREVSGIGTTAEAGKTYISTCAGRPLTCDQSYKEVARMLGIEVTNGK